MKRIMVFWLVLLFPILTFAKEYNISDIDITINVDDSYIVLTRDNLDNNPNLEKLNITKEYMFNIMEKNNIYFDIIKSDSSYEVLGIVPKSTPLFSDLSKASDDELSNLKETIKKETGDNMPIIYKNDYAFVVVNYSDKIGYNNINYYTVINNRGYNIQLQKKTKITEDDEEELRDIIDGVKFKIVDENKDEEKRPFDYKIIVYGVIIGLMAGIITYVIGSKIIDKKSSK